MTMNKGKALGEVYPFDLSYMSLDQAELCLHLVVKRDSMQNATTTIPESRKTAKMHEVPLIFSSTLMILVILVVTVMTD